MSDKKPGGMLKRATDGLVWFVTLPSRLTLPGRATLVLVLFLVGIVLLAWGLFLTSPEHVPWRHYMTPGRVMLILALVLLIPVVFYFSLRLWLEREKSNFPDLDAAWQAGLAALASRGLRLDAQPLFLFLGGSSEAQERAIMQASGASLLVESVGQSERLRWYADAHAIYLFCSDASWLSGMAALKERHLANAPPMIDEAATVLAPIVGRTQAASASFASAVTAPVGATPPASTPTQVPVGTSQAASDPRPMAQPQSTTQPEPQANRSTLRLGQHPQAATEAPVPAKPANLRTLRVSAPLEPETATQAEPATSTAPATEESGRRAWELEEVQTPVAESMGEPAILSPFESALQIRRLQYVCQRLRASRHPYCPLNGVVTLLPFDLLNGSSREIDEVQRAVQSDLTTVQQSLQLRFPVTTVVVGMEKERGFRELVRRVGRDRAIKQRFGGRHDLRIPATSQELEAVSEHVCGAFEDWVYTLFREREGLTRAGNTRLYNLLCRVRCGIGARLGAILAHGLGYDDQVMVRDEPILFSGCYFAATGKTPDRQAFVQGVFGKLLDEQELVEWSSRALAAERRNVVLFYATLIANVALVGSLVAMWFLL